jgi:hypothetical protein
MRFGTGKGFWVTLLATVAVVAAIPAQAPASGSAGTTTSLARLQPDGAASAAVINVFVLDGSSFPTEINAFVSLSGRFTVVSPEGITAPSTSAGVCTQDSPTQVSCNPGSIQAIVGDLEAGDDRFTADPALSVSIGLEVSGPNQPLLGGAGRDRLIGGAANDLIGGGAGEDLISGLAGTDILRGGAAPDRLIGGASPDGLYGGGGKDRLDGGPGRDLCNGGGAVDKGTSCTVLQSIP